MNNVAFLGTGLLGSATRMDDLIAAGHGKDDFAAIAAPVVRAS
jgi:xanthine/CO dehydrogenase XdhC/CoxF family maturation factor